jgi:hypothetical protein
VTLARTLLSATALFMSTSLLAEASEKRIFVDLAAASALHDRGEQIGREVLEIGAGVEVEVQEATVYGAFYRLLPVGAEQEAFDDEAGVTLGLAWHRHTYSADIAASHLTYPGEAADSSLELAGALSFHMPFAPTLTGFYDMDFEDWGLELAAGPDWELGEWTVYALGRAGFVHPGDGSADRSYAGIELGAARPVSERVEFGLFARADTADEDSFAHDFEGGEIDTFRNSGVAAGISLSISH